MIMRNLLKVQITFKSFKIRDFVQDVAEKIAVILSTCDFGYDLNPDTIDCQLQVALL